MNYIGSKYSLLDFIDSVVSEITANHSKKIIFCDAFAGTGAVGRYFRDKGHKIISNDIQHYSYVINRHLINNKTLKFDKIDILNNLPEKEGFIFKNYCYGSGSGRMYFSDQNGKKCDAIRQEIEKLYKLHRIDEDEYYGYLAMLIEAIDKVANTASVYGAYLKQLKKSALKTMNIAELQASNEIRGEVYNEDINTLINSIQGDILYLDPPYNTRQYSSNYHLLETISRYDRPEISGKTGLRNTEKQKSKYSSIRTVESEFEYLIKQARFSYILLSYNNEGLMSSDAVKNIMSKYGSYSLKIKEYRRFKADKTENRNHKANSTKEYLHILKKERANASI